MERSSVSLSWNKIFLVFIKRWINEYHIFSSYPNEFIHNPDYLILKKSRRTRKLNVRVQLLNSIFNQNKHFLYHVLLDIIVFFNEHSANKPLVVVFETMQCKIYNYQYSIVTSIFEIFIVIYGLLLATSKKHTIQMHF